MPKLIPDKRSPSVKSIDISKPEGIASFWNLFSKNNRKCLQNSKSITKTALKFDNTNLKYLKTNYVDIEKHYEKNKQNSTLQNNYLLLRKDQINNLISDGIMWNLKKKNNTFSGSNIYQGNFTTTSTVSFHVQSNVTCKESFKPKNDKINLTNNKKTNKVHGLINRKKDSIHRNITRRSILLKSIPTSALGQKKRKKVLIPIYIVKKKAIDMITYDKKKNAENSKHSSHLNGIIDIPSLLNKIKTMEKNLIDLEHKARKIEAAVSHKNKQKTSLHLNGPYYMTESTQETIEDLDDKKMNLMKNLIETKKVKYKITDSKSVNSPHKYKISLDGKDVKDTVVSNYKKKDLARSIREYIFNPDVLIKHHNLIIPRDFSQESLFQANPHAGCDTILNLFKALSEEKNPNKYKNPATFKPAFDHKARFQGKIQETKRNTNNTNNINRLNQFSQSNFDCEFNSTFSHKAEVETKSDIDNNKSTCDPRKKSPCVLSGRMYGNNCPERHQIFSDIFSLSMPSNGKKLSNTCNSFIGKFNDLLQETKIVQEVGMPSRITDKNIDKEKNHAESDFKHRSGKNTLIQKCSPNQNVDLVEGLSTNLPSKTFIKCRDDIEKGNEQSGDKVYDKVDGLGKFKSRSCENILNELNINRKDYLSVHKLKKCSSSTQNHHSTELLDAEINLRGNCKVNIDKVILKKVSEKQFKKTTIPSFKTINGEPQLSITICMENNPKEKPNNESQICPALGILPREQRRELSNRESFKFVNDSLKLSDEVSSFNEICTTSIENLSSDLANKSLQSFVPIMNEIRKNINVHHGTHVKESNVEDDTKISPRGNYTYLNKEQRKEFDKQILARIESNTHHFQKSVDLSNLKPKLFQNNYSHLNYDLIHKENIVLVSEGSYKSEKSDPSDAQSKRKISSKSRSYSRTPFYLESLDNKKKSNAYIFHKLKPENIYKNTTLSSPQSVVSQSDGNGSTENKNIITNCTSNSTSFEENKRQYISNNMEYESRNKQYFTVKIKENTFIGSSPNKSFNISDRKKRSCRYNLTLNQEPLLKNANSNIFSFLPHMSTGDHLTDNNFSCEKPLTTNVNITGKQCHQSKTVCQQTNRSLVESNQLDVQYNDQMLKQAKTNWNIICNPALTFNSQFDSNFLSKNTQSKDESKLLMNEIIYLGNEVEKCNENDESHFKNSQYQTVYNSKWKKSSHEPKYSENSCSQDTVKGSNFEKQNYKMDSELEQDLDSIKSHLQNVQYQKVHNRTWKHTSNESKYHQKNTSKYSVGGTQNKKQNYDLGYAREKMFGTMKPNIKSSEYQNLDSSVFADESEWSQENSSKDSVEVAQFEKQKESCDISRFSFDSSKVSFFQTKSQSYNDLNKSSMGSNYETSQCLEDKQIISVTDGASENESKIESNEEVTDSFSCIISSDSENMYHSCCPCLPLVTEEG